MCVHFLLFTWIFLAVVFHFITPRQTSKLWTQLMQLRKKAWKKFGLCGSCVYSCDGFFFFCIYFFIPLNEIYIFIVSHPVSSLMERDVLNNAQLIFGHGKMSLYEKQKTELDGLLIRRIFIIVSTVSFVSFVSHIFPYIRKLKSRNTTVTWLGFLRWPQFLFKLERIEL